MKPNYLSNLRPQTAGILLVLVAALLWSSNGMFIKLLTAGPLALTGLRALIAGATLAPAIRPRHFDNGWLLVIVVLSYTLMVLSFVTSTKWTTAANAIAIQSTSPAWVFVFTCVAARKLPRRLILPQLSILAGIGIFLLEPVSGASYSGNLLALVAGMSFAVFTFAYARLRRPGAGVIGICNLATFVILLALRPDLFAIGGSHGVPGLGALRLVEWGMLFYLGTVQVALAFLLFTMAMSRISASQVAVLALLEPLLNPIWVYFAVAEIPSGYGFAGAAAVFVGIVWDVGLRRRHPAALGESTGLATQK